MKLNKKLICLLFIIPMISLTLFGKSATSLADTPTITSLTNHTSNYSASHDPQINDRGDVVWQQRDTIDGTHWYNIYLLPHGETTPLKLTNPATPSGQFSEFSAAPQINNNGDVVWEQYQVDQNWRVEISNVYLYNGTTETVTNLTNLPVGNIQARIPQINDNGDVVYYHRSPGPVSWWPKTDVYLIKGATAASPPPPINLSDTEQAHSFQINNNGEVVWVQWDGIDYTYNVYLYDGTSTSALTDYTSDEEARFVQINNNGEVVWEGYKRSTRTLDLFFYDGTTTAKFTNSPTRDYLYQVQINDNGEVVWAQRVRSNDTYKVSLYDGTDIIDIANVQVHDGIRINNRGEVIWDQLIENGSDFTIDIFRYDGTEVTNVTNNPYNTAYVRRDSLQTNNRGDVVWEQRGSASNIYLATYNHPPVASCGDVTVDAGVDCTAIASIDNGSSDPDGDPITITQDPAGPYGLGDTVVTLTVTDDSGESDSCTATVTVVDNTCPTVTARLVPNVKKRKGCFRVELSAEDNCDEDPQIVATINHGTNGSAGVVDGQLVELKRKKKFKMKSDDGDSGSSDDDSSGDDCGTVRFEGPSFALDARAMDSAGNFCDASDIFVFADDDSNSHDGDSRSDDDSRSGHGKRK